MNGEKKSLKEDLKLIMRGCSIIRRLSPGLLGLSLLKSFLNAFTPYIAIYFSAMIIDELVGNRNFMLLMLYAGITVGGTLLFNLISELIAKKVNVLNKMSYPYLNMYLNEKTLSMDFTLLEDPKIAELRAHISENIYAAGGGVYALSGLITTIAENVMSVVIAAIVICGAVFTVKSIGGSNIGIVGSIWFSLVFISAVIICVVITVKNSKKAILKVVGLFKNGAQFNRYGRYYNFSYLKDDQAGKDIRIYDQRQLIVDEMSSKMWLPWTHVMNGSSSLYQKYFGINSALSVLIGGLAYIFIGLKALSGIISLGNVTKSYAAIVNIITAVQSLASSISQIRSNNFYLELIYEYIDLPSEVNKGNEKPRQTSDGWEIEYHDVSFRYPNTEKYVLNALSLKISAKIRIGIVGMNGSGKTTMIKLLCRLYRPESGYITLNGTNIEDYDYVEYAKLFSVVFQDFQLLSFPVGQNIAAAKEYDDEKVWRALNLSGIAERVRSFPSGLKQALYKSFDTEGVEISGGEAQKLALARALYKASPIVILDEPTAALDPIAEHDVYSKFNDIVAGKTAIFISHRLSSCRFCDTIAVFDEGQLVQFGSHVELLKDTSGKYCELWSAQAQYYEE